jgi:Siroheme synthase (precorrin-2 oxidase/ferrochelatase domain)
MEFEGRNVLVIGGGGVGTRRAVKFLMAGANVRVIGLEFSNDLVRYAEQGKVVLIKGDARDPGLLRSNMSGLTWWLSQQMTQLRMRMPGG